MNGAILGILTHPIGCVFDYIVSEKCSIFGTGRQKIVAITSGSGIPEEYYNAGDLLVVVEPCEHMCLIWWFC